jgi:hypothetical protein
MSLDEVRARLAARANLAAVVPDEWLVAEGAKASDERRDLYGMLDLPDDLGGPFLDGLDRSLAAQILGPRLSVAARLVGSDSADYRSAVDELSFAARLASCGFSVKLGGRGEPDILAARGSSEIRLELKAPLRTAELTALQDRIATGMKWPVGVTLFVGRDTYRPKSDESAAIAELVWQAARSAPAHATPVDLTSIVLPRLLRAEVGSRWARGVATTARVLVHFDPMTEIGRTIKTTTVQLNRWNDVVLAINLNALHFGSHFWTLRTIDDWREGVAEPPAVCAPPNVLGVLAFNGGLPGNAPQLAVWLPNAGRVGKDPELLQSALGCLGWPPPSVPGRTPDGL